MRREPNKEALSDRCKQTQIDHVSALKLFTEFARLSLIGFGGVLPFVRHSLVDRNGWITDKEFAEIFSVGQMLPGSNIVNVSVMLGWRFAGVAGAASAFCGLAIVPAILLIVLIGFYQHISGFLLVQHSLIGIAAVAAGLVVATGLRLATTQPKTVRAVVFGISGFAAIAVFRWPLAMVVCLVAPIAIICEWFCSRSFEPKDTNV